MVVEEEGEGDACHVQRPRRDGSHQANVSRRVQAQALLDPGVGLLRVASHADMQAALLLYPYGSQLTIAGLWDEWKDGDTGLPQLSCTMIITDANALAAKIHDRMPVLLQPKDFDGWLAGTAGTELLKPASDDYLQTWTVSRRVNSSRTPSDDPTLIEKVELPHVE